MAYIVTEACINCKHQDCVEVCPVDCFYEGINFLAINPNECIDCGVCEHECPVNAIVEHQDTEASWKWLRLNLKLSKAWPCITVKGEALPDSDAWAEVPDKLQFLSEDPG